MSDKGLGFRIKIQGLGFRVLDGGFRVQADLDSKPLTLPPKPSIPKHNYTDR